MIFERHLTVKDFMDMDNMHANSIQGKYHETNTDRSAWKIISCTIIQACCLKNISPRLLHLLIYSSFPLKKN